MTPCGGYKDVPGCRSVGLGVLRQAPETGSVAVWVCNCTQNMSTLQVLVQHPLYKQLLKFATQTDAREKVLRLLQYFVRLLRSVVFRRALSLSPEWVRLLPALQTQFTLARKPLRALKPLAHLNALSACVADELADPVLRTAEAVKQAGFVLFFSLDVVQWLKLLGVLGGQGVNERAGGLAIVQHAGEYASAAWCLALAGGLVKNGRQAQVLLARWRAKAGEKTMPEVPSSKAPATAALSTHKVLRDAVKNALDMVVALNLYRKLGLGDGVVGACGVATSVLGLQDLWNASR